MFEFNKDQIVSYLLGLQLMLTEVVLLLLVMAWVDQQLVEVLKGALEGGVELKAESLVEVQIL